MVGFMPSCAQCSTETTAAASCAEWLLQCEGRLLATLRLGEEVQFTTGVESSEGGHDPDPGEGVPYRALLRPRARPRARFAVPARCWGCAVLPGGWHHPWCDMAECPCCRGQLLSCGCSEQVTLLDLGGDTE